MSEVTNEWLEEEADELEDALTGEEPEGDLRWARNVVTAFRELKQLREELAAFSAANEGAVMVEGYVHEDEFTRAHNKEGQWQVVIWADPPENIPAVLATAEIRRKP